MTSGKRDDLITIQRATTTTNGYGDQIESWADLCTEWAETFYRSGSEKREAAVERGVQTATFRVLAHSITQSVTVADKIVFGGDWDITSVEPSGRSHIEITAVKAT